MLAGLFKKLAQHPVANPAREYEEAKREVTRRIVGCDPVTREKLHAESLAADQALQRIQYSMRGMR